jgi:drug/metabolite transporter superfamily protein YnfA
MSKYELTTEGRLKLKQAWTFSILASFAAIIGVFSYSLLYRTGDTISVTVFAVILVALTGFLLLWP